MAQSDCNCYISRTRFAHIVQIADYFFNMPQSLGGPNFIACFYRLFFIVCFYRLFFLFKR